MRIGILVALLVLGGCEGAKGGVSGAGGMVGGGGGGGMATDDGGGAEVGPVVGPYPVDAAVTEAGAVCDQGLPACSSDAFCAVGTFNGGKAVHNCLPRGGCHDCGCMFEIIDAYVEQRGSWYVPPDCWCTTATDGTVIGIECNVG